MLPILIILSISRYIGTIFSKRCIFVLFLGNIQDIYCVNAVELATETHQILI